MRLKMKSKPFLEHRSSCLSELHNPIASLKNYKVVQMARLLRRQSVISLTCCKGTREFLVSSKADYDLETQHQESVLIG